jgi:hypothetical protein
MVEAPASPEASGPSSGSPWPTRPTRLAGLIVVLALAAGCAGDGGAAPTRPVTPSLPATRVTATPVSATLPAELLGDWLQRTDSATIPGAYQQRVYRFRPDGIYEYWNEWCPSYNECSGGYEWGHVRISGNALALQPQTPSPEGERNFPFSIEPDAIGAPTLRLVTPGGADVFYRP